MFAVGDLVRLDSSVIQQYENNVPTRHERYDGVITCELFTWENTLRELEGKIGIIQNIFPDGYANVKFAEVIINIPCANLIAN